MGEMQGQSKAGQDLVAIDQQAITHLLRRLSSGEKDAFDKLVPLVYDQLRRVASRCLFSDRGDHTLRATALVHEAYIRLADAGGDWKDRAHFYAVATRVMRNILVDYARSGQRQKRGDGLEHIVLDEAVMVSSQPSQDLPALDESLNRLAAHDPRKSQVVELLFFGGLTYDEAAAALGISKATVHRELRMAKAWLHRDLKANSA
jgi:RNA polymerase sigma factor (TIGR02999 family)